MKKLIAVIPLAIFIVLLSPTIKTFAAGTLSSSAGFFEAYSDDKYYYYGIVDSMDDPTCFYGPDNLNRPGIIRVTSNNIYVSTYRFYFDIGEGQKSVGTIDEWMQAISNSNLIASGTTNFNAYYSTPILTYGISFVGNDGYDDPYVNPLPDPDEDLSWFEIWANRINNFFNDWIPWAVDADHWLDDIYLDLFGMQLDGDDVQYGNDIEFYDFPSPTPFPTQIPYQEQIIPDGNGGFTIQYIYPDPSGNPITASAPPPEPTYTIQITESPQFEISSVPVPPADGLQDAIDSIDDNIDDYQEGFEAIQGSFSVLPVKWFFFFGIPAAIILIAGIIRSLLGG